MRRHRLFHTPEGASSSPSERLAAVAPRPRINLVLYHGYSRGPCAGASPSGGPRGRGRVRSARARAVRRPDPGGGTDRARAGGTEKPCRWAWADLMRRVFDGRCPRLSPAWGPHVRDRHERGARRHPHDSQAPRPPDRAPDALPPRPASRGSVTSPTARPEGAVRHGPLARVCQDATAQAPPGPPSSGSPGAGRANFLDSRFVRTVFGLRRVLRPSAFVPAMPAGVKVEDPRASYRDTISF